MHNIWHYWIELLNFKDYYLVLLMNYYIEWFMISFIPSSSGVWNRWAFLRPAPPWWNRKRPTRTSSSSWSSPIWSSKASTSWLVLATTSSPSSATVLSTCVITIWPPSPSPPSAPPKTVNRVYNFQLNFIHFLFLLKYEYLFINNVVNIDMDIFFVSLSKAGYLLYNN